MEGLGTAVYSTFSVHGDTGKLQLAAAVTGNFPLGKASAKTQHLAFKSVYSVKYECYFSYSKYLWNKLGVFDIIADHYPNNYFPHQNIATQK